MFTEKDTAIKNYKCQKIPDSAALLNEFTSNISHSLLTMGSL